MAVEVSGEIGGCGGRVDEGEEEVAAGAGEVAVVSGGAVWVEAEVGGDVRVGGGWVAVGGVVEAVLVGVWCVAVGCAHEVVGEMGDGGRVDGERRGGDEVTSDEGASRAGDGEERVGGGAISRRFRWVCLGGGGWRCGGRRRLGGWHLRCRRWEQFGYEGVGSGGDRVECAGLESEVGLGLGVVRQGCGGGVGGGDGGGGGGRVGEGTVGGGRLLGVWEEEGGVGVEGEEAVEAFV